MHWWMLCTRAQEIPRLEKRLRVSAPRLVVQVGRRSRLQRHASAWERFLKTDSASVYSVGDYAVAYVITREGAAMLLREADKCCHDSVYVFIQSVLAQQACVLAIPFTFAQG
jgi:hypothetical protein